MSTPTPELDLNDIENKLTVWFSLKQKFDEAKLAENEARAALFAAAFPNPVFGTNKIKISHGMALIAKLPANYQIDRAALDTLLGMENAEPIVREVVNFRPEVKDGAFRALSTDDKNLMAAAITQKQGSPQMEVKPQKSVRW